MTLFFSNSLSSSSNSHHSNGISLVKMTKDLCDHKFWRHIIFLNLVAAPTQVSFFLPENFFSWLSYNYTTLVFYFTSVSYPFLFPLLDPSHPLPISKCWNCQGLSLLIYSLFLGDLFHSYDVEFYVKTYYSKASQKHLVQTWTPEFSFPYNIALHPISHILVKGIVICSVAEARILKAFLTASVFYILHPNQWQAPLILPLKYISNVSTCDVDIIII